MSDLNPYEEGLAVDLARAKARIEELEAKLRKMALDCLAADGQASDAYQAQLAAEAKLAKAVEALELADAALSGANMNMRVVERKVKAALAELKGKADE